MNQRRPGGTKRNRLPALAVCVLILLAATSVSGQHPNLVSFNSAGTGSGNARSGDFGRYRISADGRYVLFYGAGTASGALGGSELIDFTPDGRFITFSSQAQDLTSQPNGNGLGTDIYVRDTLNNVTMLVSAT